MNIYKMCTTVTRAFTIGPIKLARKRRFNSTKREKPMKSMGVTIIYIPNNLRKSVFLK